MKCRLRMRCAALWLCFPFAALAQSPTDLIHRVDDHYNHLRTLRARYAEHYTGMGLDRTESGTLTLRKPGLMRWAYDNPPGKVFVLDGKFGWFYTPGQSQVSRTPAKQIDDVRSPLRFLLGHTQLQKELDHLTVSPEGASFRIAGTPKGMAERVRQLTLTVNSEGVIQALSIEESDGATTAFTFSSIEENARIPAADFSFTPPPGTQVVDGQAPI